MPSKLLHVINLCFLITSCTKSSSTSPAPDFEKSFVISHTLDPKNNLLEVIITIKPGFHAYAPGEKIGKPVALVIDTSAGWQAQGALQIPAGHVKKLSSGHSLVLEGKIPIQQKVKIGTRNGKAQLYLQICTEHFCDRPRTHEIIINK